MKLVKSALLPPYYFKDNAMRRSATFNERNKSGVYMIYKNKVLRYVGFSASNVYKSLYRHFEEWNDRQQKRVTYTNLKDIKVRVIYCSPTRAYSLEKALIIKLKPKDNPLKYWITNTTDKKENEIYNMYTGEKVTDIITRTDEIDLGEILNNYC